MTTEQDDNQDLEKDPSKPPASLHLQCNHVNPVKTGVDRIGFPPWLSLGAILVAAFLVFPAYKGFTSGREIQRLKEEVENANRSLSLSRTQIAKLENDLYRVGLLRQGRGADLPDKGLGLFISPILSLEQKKSELPDLIQIDFRNNEDSVLAFELSRLDVEELQISILRDGNLIWLQTIRVPPKTLFVQDLVTFVLNRDRFDSGKYKIAIDGNPSRNIRRLAEFDLTIKK